MQIYRSVCDECEDIVEAGLAAGGLADGIPGRLFDCVQCGAERTVFAHPQEDKQCAAYYSEQHPAAVAEVKAVVAQLDAGVDAADVKLPKPCGCRLNMSCDVCRPPTVVPMEPDPPKCSECGAAATGRSAYGRAWLCTECGLKGGQP